MIYNNKYSPVHIQLSENSRNTIKKKVSKAYPEHVEYCIQVRRENSALEYHAVKASDLINLKQIALLEYCTEPIYRGPELGI